MIKPLPFKWMPGVVVVLFLITRAYIWIARPLDFSQIIYVYMPYAHLWAGGYLPYWNQVYEYPPLTIPLFYLPHIIDMATNLHWYHVDYLVVYRSLILATDVGLFTLIWLTLSRLKVSHGVKYISLIYYALVTAKAHDFIYDSFDLVFAGAIALGLMAPILWRKRGTFIGWILFFAAVALKYVNAPLGLPLAVSQLKQVKRLFIEVMVAGLLIWGLPVAIFRSSLLVTFVYHEHRGIQVESGPATLTRTINQQTKSEHFAEVDQAIDIQGPVSSQVMRVFTIIFPLSLILYILWAARSTWRLKPVEPDIYQIWIALGFVSLFMITSTILSTPYLLWHIPLVTVMPTKTIKAKLGLAIPSLLIVIAGMTKVPDLPIWPLSLHIWIGWVKVVGFAVIFVQVMKQLKSIHPLKVAA